MYLNICSSTIAFATLGVWIKHGYRAKTVFAQKYNFAIGVPNKVLVVSSH